jgi:hypothetical protein
MHLVRSVSSNTPSLGETGGGLGRCWHRPWSPFRVSYLSAIRYEIGGNTMVKKRTAAKRSSAQAMLSAFGRRRTWREWGKPSGVDNQVAKKRKAKRLKPNASKRRRQASLKTGPPINSAFVWLEKTQEQILRLFFQGVVGRQPETDQELKEWLASPVGRVAVMFDATSLSRWRETGRS